jgi:hypothetical protein
MPHTPTAKEEEKISVEEAKGRAKGRGLRHGEPHAYPFPFPPLRRAWLSAVGAATAPDGASIQSPPGSFAPLLHTKRSSLLLH